MHSIHRLDLLAEYQELKEKKENLEVELYNFNSAIVGRNATYDELKQEVKYRTEISDYEYKMRCVEDEMKGIMLIRAGLLTLGFLLASVTTLVCVKCSNNVKEEVSIESIEKEKEEQDVLVKTLKNN